MDTTIFGPCSAQQEAKGCITRSKMGGKYTWCDCGKKPGQGGAMSAYEQQKGAPQRCPTGTQFPVPAEDLYGYADVPPVLITDKLRVPAHLKKGAYVLSWRWDCEQTPQICGTRAPTSRSRRKA